MTDQDKSNQVKFSMPRDVRDRLKELADESDRSMVDMLRMLIKNYRQD
jgi:predicted DNA-binding protein